MTTVVGLRSNIHLDGIVLASDTQIGDYDGAELVFKGRRRKVHYGSFWAMCAEGGDSKDLQRFYGSLKGDKRFKGKFGDTQKRIEKAIEYGKFEEVNELNTKIMKKEEDYSLTHSFILAVNKPNLGLYKIDCYGNVRSSGDDKDFDYICIGSGQEEAERYIAAQLNSEEIDRDNLSLSDCILTARGAISAAETDGCTGMGFDLAVITGDKISEYGREIKRQTEIAERTILKKIALIYEDKS